MEIISDKLTKLVNEKKAGREYQLRKHDDWNENYELYRNKVKTNRLTQRQAVNIPLMRETVKTTISKIDDAPVVQWQEKSGDQMKELIYQEIWEDFAKREKIDWKDVLDKKNVLLYGLGTKKLNLEAGVGVNLSILDTFDIVFDPLMDPLDIETARFLVHQNIFRPLREILASDRYDTKGKEALKIYMATEKGVIQSGKNKAEYEKKMERIRSMGLDHGRFQYFAGGDVIVSITEHFTNFWDKKEKIFVRHVVTYADDMIELLDETLEEQMGVTVWPFVTWSEDPETNDIYPDGIADLVRVPNKLVNIWMSQLTENRTLQNFSMHWYDSTKQGYKPQTYEPGPGRMLPAPGNPNDTIMPVQINGLNETFEAINFVTQIVERGSGATALEKGTPESGAQTLGEVEILVGKATERAKTMAKFYRGSWYELCVKWNLIMQANNFPSMTLYKTGRDGKVYSKVVTDKEWKSEAGYEPDVASSSEQEADELNSIKKFGFVLSQFPDNLPLKKIAQARELKILDLSPAELKEVQDYEEMKEKQAEMAQMQSALPQENTVVQPNAPVQEAPVQPQEDSGGMDPARLEALLGQL